MRTAKTANSELIIFRDNLKMIGKVSNENKRERDLTAKGEMPNILIHPFNKIKCKGELFPLFISFIISPKSCCAQKIENGSSSAIGKELINGRQTAS